MEIIKIADGQKSTVIVIEVDEKDFKSITKKRFSFTWKELRTEMTVYKLQLEGNEDILGVIGINDIPGEQRIEIKLLASAKENIGKHKIYDGIAGCLIAYTCRLSVSRYGDMACVSLVPKTELKKHYIDKYQMLDAGWQLFLEGKFLNEMIKKYL